ncbi:hypothetical protein CEXT_596521 [Caerostris extrusa]|uniref:Uncharacterized protein n=1 Tax=Caerostris extrusa TaxID=172846 RepID=A0AAV4W9C8_CAEEX|nr:hypothetical protein CEXT_596521 [Caerostris extrusa]
MPCKGVLQDYKTVLSANDYSSFQMRMDGLALIVMPPLWIRRFSGASIFSDEICEIECWANNGRESQFSFQSVN